MNLLKEVDEKASVKEARGLLTKYRRLSRMAGIKLTDIRSPQLNGMPKTKGYGNHVEEHIVKHLDAETVINDINTAMKNMNETSFKVLYYSYCSSSKFTYYQIAPKVGYSAESMDYLKRIALLEFAESYKYGELLVYKA